MSAEQHRSAQRSCDVAPASRLDALRAPVPLCGSEPDGTGELGGREHPTQLAPRPTPSVRDVATERARQGVRRAGVWLAPYRVFFAWVTGRAALAIGLAVAIVALVAGKDPRRSGQHEVAGDAARASSTLPVRQEPERCPKGALPEPERGQPTEPAPSAPMPGASTDARPTSAPRQRSTRRPQPPSARPARWQGDVVVDPWAK